MPTTGCYCEGRVVLTGCCWFPYVAGGGVLPAYCRALRRERRGKRTGSQRTCCNAQAATHKLQRTSCNAHSATHMTMRPLRSNRSIPDTADRLAHSPDRVRLVLVPACGLCVRTLRADLLLSGFGSHVAPQLVIDQIRYALLSGADREVCSPDPTRSPTDPDQIPTRSRPDPNQIPTRCR